MKKLLLIVVFCAIAVPNALRFSYGNWADGHWGDYAPYKTQVKFGGFQK